MYKAYKDGAAALKSLREAEGLTIDSAEEAIFSLKEAVQESEEITNALSTGMYHKGKDQTLISVLNNVISANENEDQETDEELELELLALLSPEKNNGWSSFLLHVLYLSVYHGTYV